MNKHTPGPWAIDTKARNAGFAIVSLKPKASGGTKSIVTARPAYSTPEAIAEARANATLIAAAPDLLAALTALRNECSGTPRPDRLMALVVQADAALAKAKGAA